MKIEKKKPIETTGELVAIIKEPIRNEPLSILPKTFQAIPDEVNRELEVLETAIQKIGTVGETQRKIGNYYLSFFGRPSCKNSFKDLARACKCPPENCLSVSVEKAKVKIITKNRFFPQKEEWGKIIGHILQN